MEENELSFEEECVLEGRFYEAKKKINYAIVFACIFLVILMIVPQKFLPSRHPVYLTYEEANKTMFQSSSSGIAMLTLACLGTLLFLVYLNEIRYFGLKKDLDEKLKVSGKTRITKVIRSAINEPEENKKTIFHTSSTDKRYKKLHWTEGNLYLFKEGDTVDFQCGKYSGVLLHISKP